MTEKHETNTSSSGKTQTLASFIHSAKIKLKQSSLSTTSFTLLITFYLLIAFNSIFLNKVSELHGEAVPGHFMFMVSLVVFLAVVLNFFLTLSAFRFILKPFTMFLLIGSAVAFYYMKTYGILIDVNMIENVLETDVGEATEIMTLGMFIDVIIWGLIPAIIVFYIPIHYGSFVKEIIRKVVTVVLSFMIIGIIAAGYYQDYASLFRSNHYIRDLAVPINFVNAFNSIIKTRYLKTTHTLTPLGQDAHLGEVWNVKNSPTMKDKRVITVLIVGETARAENFSLNGYSRITNPELSKLPIINFSNFHSCGTSTAVSLPCMFSRQDRKHYDGSEAKYTENVLDIINRAGIPVIWLDNNSGCKGVCSRVGFQSLSYAKDPENCVEGIKGEHHGECFDSILIKNMLEKIKETSGNLMLVLHQKGSHGPAYYLRTPPEFQQFKPFCKSAQLQLCSREEITNAYDNSLLYTDYIIANVIKRLQENQDQYDSALLYLSDHGESLGENRLFLHGLPYMIAPSQQTHVPALTWLSKGYAQRFNINLSCLKLKSTDEFSQDNLFDSLLGLMDIKTAEYQSGMDIFNSCQAKH